MADQPRGGRPISASQRPTGGDKSVAGKKQFFRRKKLCRFCVDKMETPGTRYSSYSLRASHVPAPIAPIFQKMPDEEVNALLERELRAVRAERDASNSAR